MPTPLADMPEWQAIAEACRNAAALLASPGAGAQHDSTRDDLRSGRDLLKALASEGQIGKIEAGLMVVEVDRMVAFLGRTRPNDEAGIARPFPRAAQVAESLSRLGLRAPLLAAALQAGLASEVQALVLPATEQDLLTVADPAGLATLPEEQRTPALTLARQVMGMLRKLNGMQAAG